MATKRKPPEEHEKRGRQETITPAKLILLEQAFSIGASDLEACAFADIPSSTLYDYQTRHPDFTERKARLKEMPTLRARKSVVSAMETDGNLALKYLERKKKNEFSLKHEHEHSGNKNNPIVVIDAGSDPYLDDDGGDPADDL